MDIDSENYESFEETDVRETQEAKTQSFSNVNMTKLLIDGTEFII